MAVNISKPSQNSPILGQQRPEAGQRLTPAESRDALLARLAAQADSFRAPAAPVRARSERARVSVTLPPDLAAAFSDLGWSDPTAPTRLFACGLSAEDAGGFPAVPKRRTGASATLIELAHGANGAISALSTGEPITLSSLLTVARFYVRNGAFQTSLKRRSGNVSYISDHYQFLLCLAKTCRRNLAVDFMADTMQAVEPADQPADQPTDQPAA